MMQKALHQPDHSIFKTITIDSNPGHLDFLALSTMFVLWSCHYHPLLVQHLQTHMYLSHLGGGYTHSHSAGQWRIHISIEMCVCLSARMSVCACLFLSPQGRLSAKNISACYFGCTYSMGTIIYPVWVYNYVSLFLLSRQPQSSARWGHELTSPLNRCLCFTFTAVCLHLLSCSG